MKPLAFAIGVAVLIVGLFYYVIVECPTTRYYQGVVVGKAEDCYIVEFKSGSVAKVASRGKLAEIGQPVFLRVDHHGILYDDDPILIAVGEK